MTPRQRAYKKCINALERAEEVAREAYDNALPDGVHLDARDQILDAVHLLARARETMEENPV